MGLFKSLHKTNREPNVNEQVQPKIAEYVETEILEGDKRFLVFEERVYGRIGDKSCELSCYIYYYPNSNAAQFCLFGPNNNQAKTIKVPDDVTTTKQLIKYLDSVGLYPPPNAYSIEERLLVFL